ncbi:hypothetical protein J6590_086506 [Homalodisca vitripennis]|nr:hypothetical protein J6590_086506 [Homalodisca vitripennis]
MTGNLTPHKSGNYSNTKKRKEQEKELLHSGCLPSIEVRACGHVLSTEKCDAQPQALFDSVLGVWSIPSTGLDFLRVVLAFMWHIS